MLSNTSWFAAWLIGSAIVVAAAAIGRPEQHMFVVGLVTSAFAALSIRELLQLRFSSANDHLIARSTARCSALVWAWGGLSIFAIYTAVNLGQWPEWWHFVLGFACAAAASLAFAMLLGRDADMATTDTSLIKIGRTLAGLQLAGAILGLISMIHDGKFPRAATHSDWAACNIFFFGALAIAIISVNALRSARSLK